MRKSFFVVVCFLLAMCSFVFGDFRVIQNDIFDAGENYEYKVKYGFFNIGDATVDVDDKIFNLNGRPCYKVNVFGKTTGLTDVFKVRNTYRSYIDTAAFLPMRFVYSARENNYKRDHTITFDHRKDEALKIENDKSKIFKVPNNIQDVISGYYLLRTVDFSKFSIGQSFSAPIFFEDDLYQMKVKYAGKGTVKTRYGKIGVIKLNPVLPKNEMFKGENAIRIWVSDDKNRVPIKIEADFSMGTIEMELKRYQKVKYAFNWR